MATATLKGTTQLDTSGMRRGFAQLKTALKDFKAQVAAPFAQATSAASNFAKKTLLVTAAIGGIATKDIFDGEQVEAQFQMLGMSADEAKKHCEDLRKLGMESSDSWFSPGEWEQASLMLHKIGGAALATGPGLRAIGEAAAVAGKPLPEVAHMIGDFYSRLIAGKDPARAAIQLFQSGIINEAELKNIQDLAKSGADVSKTWAVVTGAMQRATGSMQLLANTGKGQVGTLKVAVGEAMEKVFAGLADAVKDCAYNIVNWINRIYNDGTLDKWSKAIGRNVRDFVNFVNRIIDAFQHLNDQQRSQLTGLVGIAAAAFVSWKIGFLGPMLQGMIGLVKFTATHIAAVTAILGAAVAAWAGFKLGSAIWETLTPDAKGVLEKVALVLDGLLKEFVLFFTTALKMATEFGIQLWDAVTGKKSFKDGAGDWWKNVRDHFMDGMKDVVKDIQAYNGKVDLTPDDGIETIMSGGKPVVKPESDFISADSLTKMEKQAGNAGKSLREALKNEFSLETIKKEIESALGGLMPDSLKAFLDKLGKNKGLELPKVPPSERLSNKMGIPQAQKGIEKLKQSMKDMTAPLRGIYQDLGGFVKLQKPADALAGAKEDRPDQEAIERNSHEIKSNTEALKNLSTTFNNLTTKGMQALWA